MERQLSNRIVYAGAIIACVLWASAFIGGKYALSYLPPLHLAGYRLLTASMMLLLVLRKNPFAPLKGHMRWVVVLSFFNTIFLFSAFNLGLSRVPGSLGSIIIGASPAISSVVAVIFIKDEHLTLRKIIGLCIGLIGIIVLALSRNPWSSTGRSELIGVLLLLSCNFSTAFGAVVIKKKLSKVPSLSLSTAQTLIGGVIVMLLAVLFESNEAVEISIPVLMSIVYLAFVSAAAVTIWLTIIKQPHVKISNIALWKFLIPSLGSVLSWLFIPGESPSIIMVTGMIAIVIAILFTVSDAKDEQKIQKKGKSAIIPNGGKVS